MFCGKCGNQIPDDAVFCDGCGAATGVTVSAEAPAPAMVFCANCGNKMAANEAFCGECGTAVGAVASTPVVSAPVVSAPVMEAPAAPEMAFCANCGNKMAANEAFCGECGTAVGVVASAPVVSAPVVSAPVVEAPAAPAMVFCANCGNKMAADEVFCGVCGTRTGVPAYSAPAQPMYRAPAPAAAPAPAQSGGLNIKLNENGFFKKDAYFLNRADSKSRMTYFISWGLVLACLLCMIFSWVVALNGDMLNRPYGSLIENMTNGNMSRLRKSFIEDVDRIQSLAEDTDFDEGKIEKAVNKLDGKFSLTNMRNCIKLYEMVYEEIGFNSMAAEARQVDAVLGGMVAVIVCGFLAAIILTVLAAVFKKFPLAIVAIAVAVGFVAVFSGILWVLLSLAAYIGLIILYVKLGNEYKSYAKAAKLA